MKTFANYFKIIRPCLISAMLLTTLIYTTATAQISSLNAGERVRVLAPDVHDQLIDGTVESVNSSEIFLTTGSYSYSIPLSSIKELEIHNGKKRRTLAGALIGSSVGGLTGGIIGASSKQECEGAECLFEEPIRGLAIIYSTVLGTVTGLIAGGFIGYLIQTDRWERVPVEFSLNIPSVPSKRLSFSPSVSISIPIGGSD